MAAALPLFAVAPASGQLYFADIFNPEFSSGEISRVNVNGTGLEQLVDTGGGIRGLDLDLPGGKMYWADVDDSVIRRANLDGSGQEDLIDLVGGKEGPFPSALAVDSATDKIYWGDQTLGTMNRANLDGSGQEVLFSTPFHRGLAIDHENGKMYWSTSISQFKGEIWRSNLDGTDQELVVSSKDSRFKPNKIALDIAGGKIYWTDYVVDIVRRSNLDGSGIQTLYTPPFNRNPEGITLDLQAGMVYWGQDIEIEGHTGKIMAMGLDGSNPHNIITGFGHVNEIVYAPVPEPATLLILSAGLFTLIRARRAK
jgi:DNA-binding beta-propeller fold protein YncE